MPSIGLATEGLRPIAIEAMAGRPISPERCSQMHGCLPNRFDRLKALSGVEGQREPARYRPRAPAFAERSEDEGCPP